MHLDDSRVIQQQGQRERHLRIRRGSKAFRNRRDHCGGPGACQRHNAHDWNRRRPQHDNRQQVLGQMAEPQLRKGGLAIACRKKSKPRATVSVRQANASERSACSLTRHRPQAFLPLERVVRMFGRFAPVGAVPYPGSARMKMPPPGAHR